MNKEQFNHNLKKTKRQEFTQREIADLIASDIVDTIYEQIRECTSNGLQGQAVLSRIIHKLKNE